jgi:hypothetical protein
MPKQITKWITIDGKEFDLELYALRHEILILKKELEKIKYTENLIKKTKENNYSSCSPSAGFL